MEANFSPMIRRCRTRTAPKVSFKKIISRKRTAEDGPLRRSNKIMELDDRREPQPTTSDDDELLLTPAKRHRSCSNKDRFFLSNLDAATIQLLMDSEGESSTEELPEVPIIDVSGMPEELLLAASLSPSKSLSPTTPQSSPPPPPSASPEQSASASHLWSPDPPASRPSLGFSGDSALLETPEGVSPGHFFDLMFTIGFFNLLVREINGFAEELMCRKACEQQQRMEKRLTPLKKPLIFNWRDVTVDDVKKWLGITFMMGIIKLDRLRDYWAQDERFSLPFFRGHMARDRWFSILEALHFAPNETSTDPIFKIRPLLKYFHDRMAALINPGRKVDIDESSAFWRGRISFRHLPLKGRKYGIKLYMLTEHDGLIHRFLVYVGAGDAAVSGQGHTTEVVQKLMSGYDEGRSGSIRKPQSVVEYNKSMGGIDHVDQHLAYTSPHRSIKCYKTFGLHIMELMLLNAYSLYRRFSVLSLKLDLYSFRLAVVDHLCGPSLTPAPSKVVLDHDTIVEKHFPRVQPLPNKTSGRRKQLRCRFCYKRKIVTKTTTYCGGCPGDPGLCLELCFIEYHRKLGVNIL